MKYVALLRGINVGGNNKLPMAELRQCLSEIGLDNVKTYIQSGNLLFESDETDKTKLTSKLEECIQNQFGLTVPVVLLSRPEYEHIAANVPKNWMNNPDWKYNYIFLKQPYDIGQVLTNIGQLKPDIESLDVGQGVLYQGISIKGFGSAAGGNIAGKSVYKIMTIRNHNTVSKLVELLQDG